MPLRHQVMTTQIISAIAFSVIATITVIGYVRECNKIKKIKAEIKAAEERNNIREEFLVKLEQMRARIQRRLLRCKEACLSEFVMKLNGQNDEYLSQIIQDENMEIEAEVMEFEKMIEQYKRM